MKCVICHNDDLLQREVVEHVSHGNDIVCVPLNVLVCNTCGERYYSPAAMRELEQAKESLSDPNTNFSVVGRVLLREDSAPYVATTDHH